MKTRELLATTMLVAAVLPLALVTFARFHTESALTASLRDHHLAAVAAVAARDAGGRVERLLDNMRADATLPQLAAALGDLSRVDPIAVGRILSVVALREPLNVTSVGLLDRHGRNVADTLPSRVGTDESRQPYTELALASGYPRFIGPLATIWRGDPAVFIATPVKDSGDRVVGLLRIELQASLIGQVLAESLAAHPDLHAVVLGERGAVEAATDGRIVLGTTTQLPLPDRADDFQAFGAEQRGAIALIAHVDKRVLVYEPRSQYERPLQAQRRDWVVNQLLLVLLVLAAVWYVAARLARPATVLAAAADAVADGRQESDVEVGGSEEMQRLGRAFNSMNQQVREHVAELHRLNTDLEQRVVQRTAELQAATHSAVAASASKSAFLANMSHEIRTPLNAVIGLTSLMLAEPLAPRDAERLNKVQAAAEHLLGILNDVLDISKIEAGRLEIERAPFALRQAIDHVRDLVAERAAAKALPITVELPPRAERVIGDRLRLQQVLLNLLANAVKFTDAGRIDIHVAPQPGTGDGLRFEVLDTGIGVAEQARPRLFEAFAQADASVSRQYGGTGLGLAISRRLVGLMGGEIGYAPREGGGSVFWFHLPLPAAPALPPFAAALAADATRADLGPVFRGQHVLLVEDNPVNQEVAQASLELMGLAVDIADDGQRAVAMARAKRYDLILMDLQMPVMDGLEATRLIRGLSSHHVTPIVAMTANAFDEDRRRCEAAGMNDHIAKPIGLAALRRALARWLQAERQ